MGTQSLMELTIRYFKQKGYKVKPEVELEGASGILQTFDLLVSKQGAQHLVSIKDWRRTVGVNIIINVDRASTDVGMFNPVVVATKFSDHAKAYANRKGITLLSKRDILFQLGKT